MNGKQVCKILSQNGWILKRINGSHYIYGKPGQPPVAVPVHGKTDLGTGLLLKIQRQTGIKLS